MTTLENPALEHATFEGSSESKRRALQAVVEMRTAGETITSTTIGDRVGLDGVTIRAFKSKDPAFALAYDVAMGTREVKTPEPKPVTPESEIPRLEAELDEMKAQVRVLKRWRRDGEDVDFKLRRAQERVHGLTAQIEIARSPRTSPYDL